MTSLTSVVRSFHKICLVCVFIILQVAQFSSAQGDPERIPTGADRQGLVYQSAFNVWPVCANSWDELFTAFNASAERWCTTTFFGGCMEVENFIRLPKFCGALETMHYPSNTCLVGREPETLLSWATSTCHLTSTTADRWATQQASIVKDLKPTDSFNRGPACGSKCSSLTNLYSSSLWTESCSGTALQTACISRYSSNCALNRTLLETRCRPSQKYINTTRYCDGLAGITDYCPDSCTFGNEPRSLFSFLNSTCALERPVIMPWRNTTLAKEERWLSDWIPSLLPWTWAVQSHAHPIEPSSRGIEITDPLTSSIPYISVRPSGAGSCPSSSSQQLGVFAAVNVMSACLLPILGRRTFVQKVTFGIGGRLGSKGWYLLGFASACMQIVSNIINAYIIRITPGYEHISFTALALFWCTRPRLSWLAVFLATYQADKGMYFNSAASAITTEALLQSLGAVYFGIIANYGRKKGFYLLKHLDPYPRGKAAHIMYAGVLLWLIVFLFTLAACVFSIIGLNKVISNARSMMARATGAGTTAVRAPPQKWLPKWVQTRIAERQKRLENAPKKPPRNLTPSEVQEIESVTAAGIIFLSFLAQWLFWAGFIKAAGERYCPPKLATLGVVWGSFSALGFFVGSAH